MNKENLIFITNYFGNGGAATVMKTLSQELNTNNYNVTIISFLDDENKYEIPNNCNYIFLNEKNKLKRIIKLRKILKKYKKSTIISFEYFVNMQTIIANFFLDNNIIVSERNDPNREGNHVRTIRNVLYFFSSKLVCQTEEAKLYFPKYIRKKTYVIPNPVKENLPARYDGVRNNDIVTFCRIEKQKNLILLIDSFIEVYKKHPNMKLKIYGNGSEKNNIEEYIKNNSIKFIEMYDFDKDIHSKILKSKMFVSSSDYEGISNSMMEAMAIGIPTICTDCPCGGAKMMIEDKVNGILVPVRDKEKLIDAMNYIIENEDFANKLSLNSIKIKDKYNIKKITEMWKKIIE